MCDVVVPENERSSWALKELGILDYSLGLPRVAKN